MLSPEVNSDSINSSNELSSSETLSKKPNLTLCKELIFSCTENVENRNSNSLKKSGCHSNPKKKKDQIPTLKPSNQGVSSLSKCPKKRKKQTPSILKIKFKNVLFNQKTSKKIQKYSANKKISSRKRKNGMMKNSPIMPFSAKNYRKHIKLLKSELEDDLYGEKLLNILKTFKCGYGTPSVDKRLNLTVCLLSMIVYKKCKGALFDKFVKKISPKKLTNQFNDSNNQELPSLKKRIISMTKGLNNLSSTKCKAEKKYLRVSLKKLPDCIFNYLRNQTTSTFSDLPDHICDNCRTVDVRVVVSKLPDKIFHNYKKGKPIMLSNLPLSILDSLVSHSNTDSKLNVNNFV